MPDIQIGDPIPKNSREHLRVSLTEYHERDLIALRVFYDAGEEFRPGKQGIVLRVQAIPDMIDRLQMALAEAERQGMLPDRGQHEPIAA